MAHALLSRQSSVDEVNDSIIRAVGQLGIDLSEHTVCTAFALTVKVSICSLATAYVPTVLTFGTQDNELDKFDLTMVAMAVVLQHACIGISSERHILKMIRLISRDKVDDAAVQEQLRCTIQQCSPIEMLAEYERKMRDLSTSHKDAGSRGDSVELAKLGREIKTLFVEALPLCAVLLKAKSSPE